jgi:hypothetical protein
MHYPFTAMPSIYGLHCLNKAETPPLSYTLHKKLTNKQHCLPSATRIPGWKMAS